MLTKQNYDMLGVCISEKWPICGSGNDMIYDDIRMQLAVLQLYIKDDFFLQ